MCLQPLEARGSTRERPLRRPACLWGIWVLCLVFWLLRLRQGRSCPGKETQRPLGLGVARGRRVLVRCEERGGSISPADGFCAPNGFVFKTMFRTHLPPEAPDLPGKGEPAAASACGQWGGGSGRRRQLRPATEGRATTGLPAAPREAGPCALAPERLGIRARGPHLRTCSS